ncbi:hypothetical protein [Polaromonas glacialis]|uniref:hypothetical protein n=1 Tax=Polaromonas glacialis TaxID=866564 RepID=UPI000A051306|nr:hypothetical protein [Polaromonas glacialis]
MVKSRHTECRNKHSRRFFGLYVFHWALLLVTAVGPLLYLPSLQAQTRPAYTAIEYARLDNPGATTVIRGMNSTNEVAGGFKKDKRKASSALIFMANNAVEDVAGEQGAGNSVAYGINDQSEIVGALNTSVALHPFRAVRRGGVQELTLPPGTNGGIAYAINELGEAAGYASGDIGIRAVWWTRRGEVQLLQSIGTLTTRALDLNDRGDIVGVSGNEVKTAVAWPRKGGIISLGTLPGFVHSEAVSITENGAIAGVAIGAGEFPNRSRAVLWQPGGVGIRDLGTLNGGSDSRARDVNNRGEVVGTSSSTEGDRAFVWTAATGMLDLNSLVTIPGLVMTDALSINKTGDIVVMGHDGQTGEPQESHEHVDHHVARRIFVLHPLR